MGDRVLENTGDFLFSGWPRYVRLPANEVRKLIQSAKVDCSTVDYSSSRPVKVKRFLRRFKKEEKMVAINILAEESKHAMKKLSKIRSHHG